MWAAIIDFTKAFDSITHKSMWDALKFCNIEHDHIRFLKKLFRDQKATVLTDEESDTFEMKKGTKQGDHSQACSSTGFCRKHWKIHSALAKKKNGNQFERPRPPLLHELEVCRRRASVRNLKRTAPKMLCEFKRRTEKVGLRIHPGKTNILSNQSDDIKVEISTQEESTNYLGQMITFQQQETTEIRNRIRAAWATFHKYR